MTPFATLSTEAQNIVNNFIAASRAKSFLTEAHKQIMVSLYGEMPNADKEVLDVLSHYQIHLDDYFSKSEIQTLTEEYSAVINYCYKYCDFSKGGVAQVKAGKPFIPESLVQLCGSIIDSTEGKSILLPYTGMGAFAPLCSTASFVEGFEIYPEAWALSQIMLKSVNPSAAIQLGDSDSLNIMGRKYDHILAFPPILPGKDGRKVIDLFYRLITEHLNEDGELCVILPLSYCYATSGWFDVRKIMLDHKGYSTMVIALPPMLQLFTSVPLCLVQFVKNNKEMIVLADASSDDFKAFHTVAGKKGFSLKVDSIVESIRDCDERYVWVGDIHMLNGDINMMPSRYLVNQNLSPIPEGYTSYKLGDLITICPRVRSNNNTEMPLVGMKELSATYLNCEIALNDIPSSPSYGSYCISSDSLLVGFIGGKFKVGKISGLSEDKMVSLRNEVIAFNIKNDVVSEDFLLREIMGKKVETQGLALATGVTISRISKEDFLSIVILVPSREEQDHLCKEDTRVSLTEADRRLIESAEEFRKDMHMKKHAIGQTIYNLSNWWKVLQKARKEGHGVVSDDAIVGKSQPVPVSEIYNNLQEVITKLQHQINTLDRGNGLVSQNFALTEFIENYISNPANKSPLFTYMYDNTSHHAGQTIPVIDFDETTGKSVPTGDIVIKEGDPIEYVDFAPDALKIIFDNIVSNAACHGFEGRGNNLNIIKIELFSEGENHIITISNNGNPLHKQISHKDVFTYNKSSKNGGSHFGIGGYEIKKLMNEFGGDAEILSDSQSEFPVTYKLVFNKTNIIASFSL